MKIFEKSYLYKLYDKTHAFDVKMKVSLSGLFYAAFLLNILILEIESTEECNLREGLAK
jgi:hypothetical protein